MEEAHGLKLCCAGDDGSLYGCQMYLMCNAHKSVRVLHPLEIKPGTPDLYGRRSTTRREFRALMFVEGAIVK